MHGMHKLQAWPIAHCHRTCCCFLFYLCVCSPSILLKAKPKSDAYQQLNGYELTLKLISCANNNNGIKWVWKKNNHQRSENKNWWNKSDLKNMMKWNRVYFDTCHTTRGKTLSIASNNNNECDTFHFLFTCQL